MNTRLPRLTPVLILVVAAALVAPRHRSSTAGTGDSQTDSSIPGIAEQTAAVSSTERGSLSVGDQLVVQAAHQLERRSSVVTRLRHQVAIAGKRSYGVGSYWQQGSGDELRVRLEIQIAGQEASLLQVSNSRFLWVDRQFPTGRTVTRTDLRQLRADSVLTGTDFGDTLPGNATWSTLQPEMIAHCGGLPSLLAALGENFSFLPPQAMRLAIAPPATSQASSIPVFAVVGHWKPEKLSALLMKESQESKAKSREPESLNAQLSTLNSLPNRLPQEVLLLVGQADLFPYRIEYRRLETPLPSSGDALPVPYQLSANPMVVLELADVAFDVPITAGQFDYAPGDAAWTDQTATVLERLRRERQQQIAVRHGIDGTSSPVR